jgi:uncharacterized protein (TIGR03435 family)
MVRNASTVAAFLLAAATLVAQAQPAFEVASVRIDNGDYRADALGINGGPGTSNPERFTAIQVPLSMLLLRAFDLESDQLDGPSWLRDLQQKYTISALVPPNTTKPQFQLMLQNLLIERFSIRSHWETRSFPSYELSVAPGGPKQLTKWTPEPIPDGPTPRFSSDADGFPELPQGRMLSLYGYVPGRASTLKVSVRQSMAGFRKDLGRFINISNAAASGAPMPRVLDKTGLPDVYEFRLEFAGTVNLANMPPDPSQNIGDGGPSLFAALERELGLKLVKRGDVPTQVLVVDYAEKLPAEN